MLTVMPIVVVPCLVGGYWLPRCACQCSRGKVGVKQTATESVAEESSEESSEGSSKGSSEEEN